MSVSQISVVIPTRNRCSILELTLKALARQRGADGTFEVIVADDGSTDTTREMLRSMQTPFKLKTVFLDPGGPARARNWAIREAEAPRVLLLGDDMLPSPENVAIHVKATQDPDHGLQGAIDWDPAVGITDVMRFLAPEGPQFWFKGLEDGSEVSWTSVASSNLSAPADWFLDEPFDESFTEACFEDTEMALRWAKRGRTVVFSHAARCLHHHRYGDIWPFLARQRRAGWWARQAVRRHPRILTKVFIGPVAMAPLLAIRAVSRSIIGKGGPEFGWDLRCRLAFATGFVVGDSKHRNRPAVMCR